MKTPALNELLTLQKPRAVKDDIGGQAVTYDPVDTAYGDVRTLSGRESLQAAAIQATLSHRVTLRYRDDIRPSWRLVRDDETTVLEILAVRETVRRLWLELDCVSR